jgi:hypothetical protein
MYYFKYKSGPTRIEFSNSFSGKETIKANGQIVSEKSSILGTDHHFDVYENSQKVHYTLRTKIAGPTMVAIDLIRNSEYILRNESVPYGSAEDRQSIYYKDGLVKLRSFELNAAVDLFAKGLNIEVDNPQLHFYKACAHSLLEQKELAFHHLELALEHGLVNRKSIFTEDALAFVRVEDEFEAFKKKHHLDK